LTRNDVFQIIRSLYQIYNEGGDIMSITTVTGSTFTINNQALYGEAALLQESVASGSEFLTASLELFESGYESRGFYSDGANHFMIFHKSPNKK